jgi:hypothetical protein
MMRRNGREEEKRFNVEKEKFQFKFKRPKVRKDWVLSDTKDGS